MKLSFIQLSAFASTWKRMKLTDDDLRALEIAITEAPDAPTIMKGTGGLRKIRFAPASSGAGKSGGARACYAYFPEFGLVYLCAVFSKSAKANLNQSERQAYRKALESLRQHLKDLSKRGLTP